MVVIIQIPQEQLTVQINFNRTIKFDRHGESFTCSFSGLEQILFNREIEGGEYTPYFEMPDTLDYITFRDEEQNKIFSEQIKTDGGDFFFLTSFSIDTFTALTERVFPTVICMDLIIEEMECTLPHRYFNDDDDAKKEIFLKTFDNVRAKTFPMKDLGVPAKFLSACECYCKPLMDTIPWLVEHNFAEINLE